MSPRLRSAIDLSGVVQQTLLDAIRSPPRPRTEAETAAWLRAILRNNLADEARREGARKRDRGRVRPLDPADGGPTAGHSTPSQRAIRAEDLLRMAEALADLPEDQCRAVETKKGPASFRRKPFLEAEFALEEAKLCTTPRLGLEPRT